MIDYEDMIVKRLAHFLNPMLLGLAASGVIPVWGVVRHRGRRSGRVYETPIALQATAQGFVIPLPYSERTDWCRNVIAAGGGEVRWRGVDHRVTGPTVVDRAAAAPAYNAVLRFLIGLFGIDRFLVVQRAG